MSANQLESLKNLGPKSVRMLEAIGVRSREDISELGALEVWDRLRLAGFRPSLVMLYALEGALAGVHWNAIAVERKLELQRLVKALEQEDL